MSVNYDSEEYQEELKLSEPVLSDITRAFPEKAQKAGMKKEMDSMHEFNVYTETRRLRLSKFLRNGSVRQLI